MFNFTLLRDDILTPLLTVAGAVDKKQSLPILSNILLTLKDNQIQLTATDLEIEMSCRVACHSSEGEGQTTIPAKKLVDIIRNLDDAAHPHFLCDEQLLAIKERRSLFKLATLPAELYPNTEEEKYEVEFYLPRESLIHLLQMTQFAMSAQDVRIFLNGLMLEIDAQHLTAISSDGHRMAIAKIHLKEPLSHQKILLPRKGVQELLRLLNNVDDEKVLICLGQSNFKLVTEQYHFLAKLIDARYPPYTKAIPRSLDKRVVLDKDLLKRALNRIVILAHEKSRAIVLHVQSGQLTLIANNQEKEEAVENLVAQTEGDEVKIGINASYLSDVLAVLPDAPIQISFGEANSSILVESLSESLYQYIIMPMKL